MLRVKKPSPSMAMSQLRPVWLTLPWVNCWEILLRRAPEPMVLPARPAPVELSTSANSARDSLKPTVLTLAMLLAVTLRSALAALMPDREALKPMAILLEVLWKAWLS